ncbi:MAG: hypothetical protein QXT38_04200 [Candidatus Aenigmatarchaeota archaeon]
MKRKKIKLRIEFTYNKKTEYWKWLMAILKRNPTFRSWEENGIKFYYFEVDFKDILEYQRAIELVIHWKTTRVWINKQPVDWRSIPYLIDEIRRKIQNKKILQEVEKIIDEQKENNKIKDETPPTNTGGVFMGFTLDDILKEKTDNEENNDEIE